MPVKVTTEQVDKIVYLRDERQWPWERISEDVGLDEKTCRKHYKLRKEEEGGTPRGEGALHARAFQLFDQGGGPGDAVRQLQIPLEEAKELYEEYLEMEGREDREEAELPVSEEFEAFKKRRDLTYRCDRLLDALEAPFEEALADDRDLIRERVSFLRERVEAERELKRLEELGGLLESEAEEVKALQAKDRELYEERRGREREEKRMWIIRRRMDRLGVGEEEARKDLDEMVDLYEDGLEGVYRLEKKMERCEEIRNECLKYMSLGDCNRLTLLFFESLPSAEYLIRFWRQEQDIVARYEEAGWRELNRLYQTHRDILARERPELRKAFMRHLWRRGLQPCPYCNLLINVVGAPQQFRCPRCGGQLVRSIY